MAVFRAHDDAIVNAVASIGRPTGRGEAPPGALNNLLNQTGPGYYIVYPLPGGFRDGSAKNPYDMVELVYQVTCVDRGPEGARWLSDQLEPALVSVSVSGRSRLWMMPTQPAGIFRDDETAAAPLFISTPTFRFATTP